MELAGGREAGLSIVLAHEARPTAIAIKGINRLEHFIAIKVAISFGPKESFTPGMEGS